MDLIGIVSKHIFKLRPLSCLMIIIVIITSAEREIRIRDAQECIKVDLFDKTGHAKSVGFRFYSAI